MSLDGDGPDGHGGDAHVGVVTGSPPYGVRECCPRCGGKEPLGRMHWCAEPEPAVVRPADLRRTWYPQWNQQVKMKALGVGLISWIHFESNGDFLCLLGDCIAWVCTYLRRGDVLALRATCTRLRDMLHASNEVWRGFARPGVTLDSLDPHRVPTPHTNWFHLMKPFICTRNYKTILYGMPGVGKTSLARRLHSLGTNVWNASAAQQVRPLQVAKPPDAGAANSERFDNYETRVSTGTRHCTLSLWDSEMWGYGGDPAIDLARRRRTEAHARQLREWLQASYGETYNTLRYRTFVDADVFLLCYALDDPSSLAYLIDEVKGPLHVYLNPPTPSARYTALKASSVSRRRPCVVLCGTKFDAVACVDVDTAAALDWKVQSVVASSSEQQLPLLRQLIDLVQPQAFVCASPHPVQLKRVIQAVLLSAQRGGTQHSKTLQRETIEVMRHL